MKTNIDLSAFLKQLRTKKKLTQQELAEKLDVTKMAISRYENNHSPSDKILLRYSQFFNINYSELWAMKTKNQIDEMNKEIDENNNLDYFEVVEIQNFLKDHDIVKIPYFESVSAGIEQGLVSDYPLEMMTVVLKKGTYSNLKALVAIKVNGESMNRVIPNHSIAIIDKQAHIKNNDIIGYQLSGDYGLKRFEDAGDSILLKPDSFSKYFKDKIIPKEAINDLEFMIIGKVIHIQTNDFSLENS